MNFRFRKSFTIIPGILKWTVSKKSTSLNLNLGIFSRSWGTRGKTTTLDMPGTSGIFWRKEERRKKGNKGQAGGSKTMPDVSDNTLTKPAGISLYAIAFAAQALIYWVWGKMSSDDNGFQHSLMLVLGLQLMVYVLVRVTNRVGTGANVLLVGALLAVTWFAARAFVLG